MHSVYDPSLIATNILADSGHVRGIIVTNKRTIGPFREDGGHPFTLMAADGYQVKKLFGLSGTVLDAVAIIAERQ